MTAGTGLDVARLPVYVSGSRGLLWWGMIMLVTIEVMVFSTFLSSYFFYRSMAPEWPPAGTSAPDLLLPTINTLVLAASSLSIWWADRGIRHGDVARLKLGAGAAILFSAMFLVLKVVEYRGVPYYWDTDAYGSIVWTVIVFHSAHVGSVLLKGVVVEVLAFRGHFTGQRHLGVDINGIYWHFVVVIWLPIYFTLYWVPRL
jgi:cytochrome c oxidase subunit III